MVDSAALPPIHGIRRCLGRGPRGRCPADCCGNRSYIGNRRSHACLRRRSAHHKRRFRPNIRQYLQTTHTSCAAQHRYICHNVSTHFTILCLIMLEANDRQTLRKNYIRIDSIKPNKQKANCKAINITESRCFQWQTSNPYRSFCPWSLAGNCIVLRQRKCLHFDKVHDRLLKSKDTEFEWKSDEEKEKSTIWILFLLCLQQRRKQKQTNDNPIIQIKTLKSYHQMQ